MKNVLNLRARGIAGVRADAPALAAQIEVVNQIVTQMRAEQQAADVLTTEKVDRMNAEITTLTTAIEANKAALDAARIGGGEGCAPLSAEAQERKTAFLNYFRKGQVSAKLSTQDDPNGGYMVPDEMSATIDRVLGTMSAMRSLANVIQIGSSSYSKLVNLAGTGTGWVGEEQARPETATPTLAKIDIPAGEIYATPATSQRMLDDAMFDVEAWLAGEVSVAFAEAEGLAFITGNGINKPRGFLDYDTVANASYAWGKLGFVVTGTAATFGANAAGPDAMIDLFTSLRSGYRMGASFLTNDVTLGKIRQFKDGQGAYLWSPPTTDTPATVLGKPIVTDDNMPLLGAGAFPVAFGNFGMGYTIVDRTNAILIRDNVTSKPNVIFYTTKRVGGAVTNFEAIKLLKCST